MKKRISQPKTITTIDSGFLDGLARDLYYQKNICPHNMGCNSRDCYNTELYNKNKCKQQYVPFYNDDIIRTTSYQPFNQYESYYSYQDTQYYK